MPGQDMPGREGERPSLLIFQAIHLASPYAPFAYVKARRAADWLSSRLDVKMA